MNKLEIFPIKNASITQMVDLHIFILGSYLHWICIPIYLHFKYYVLQYKASICVTLTFHLRYFQRNTNIAQILSLLTLHWSNSFGQYWKRVKWGTISYQCIQYWGKIGFLREGYTILS